MREEQTEGTGRDQPIGADAPLENRPGVPMEAASALPAEPEPIARQPGDESHFRRVGLEELTPVYGTAQPPRGVSGKMRKMAYSIPEHSAMHWMTLLLADRVDVMEDYLTHGIGPGTLNALGRRVRNNPLPMLVLGAAAGFAVRRALR